MSETKRKFFIVIVLGLVLIFGVGQFFAYSNLNTANQQGSNQNGATGGSNNPPATQVIAYVPPTLASSTPVERGSCFANSVAAPYRRDAYRCTVGNAISDPCFIAPSGNSAPGNTTESNLLCGANPTAVGTSTAFALRLTKSLPKPEVPSSTPTNWAWMVELSDGTVCTPFTGTRPFTATGEIASYSCNAAAPGEDMIFGDLNNTGAAWTAEVGSLSTTTSTFPPIIVASATVPVFAVWQ